MNKTAELEKQLKDISSKLDRTDQKLRCRDYGTCSCINFLLLAVAVIAFFVVSDNFIQSGEGEDKSTDDDNEFSKLANMIDAQNDDNLDEVESKLMKKFTSLGKSVYNLKS